MVMRVILAIDPGTTGAMALFHDDRLEIVQRLPVVSRSVTRQRKDKKTGEMKSTKGTANSLDVQALARFARFAAESHPGAVLQGVIEYQQGRGPEKERGGSAQMGTLMRLFGQCEGVLIGRGWEVTTVPPAAWKRHFGLGKDKDVARALAANRWPSLDLKTKKSADIAEACLLGAWWLETQL
jgi:hypothetical protein